MKKQSTLNKGLATVLALSLGATLSTYGATAALWRAEETIEFTDTLTSGHLKMEPVEWTGTVADIPGEVVGMSSVSVSAPAGKKITYISDDITLDFIGTNLNAEFKVEVTDGNNDASVGFQCDVKKNGLHVGTVGTEISVATSDTMRVECQAMFPSGESSDGNSFIKSVSYSLRQVVN